MSDARERMLARIRERQGRPREATSEEREAVRAHLAAHARNAAPRAEGDALARFRERALALASTLDSVEAVDSVPAAVARYLESHGLGTRAVCWPSLAHLAWAASGLAVEARNARSDDLVGITGAFCAVAETGTLVTLSGPETPPSVSLLPETHIAIVTAPRVVRSMEDAWALVREHGALPRAVGFISGPSRTADIEQTVTLGAHGPYRVHIVVAGV
jgi:L-lactate dehydrogenase complex protein LldG